MVESLDGVIDEGGAKRARYVMLRLLERARERQVGVPPLTSTDYINTIAPEQEPWFPGDEMIERRIRAYIRWNAAMLVHRAQRPEIGVGGHISTYASSASLYEVGFNTSSAARTTRAAATRSTSRATRPRACTRGVMEAGSPRTTWTDSARSCRTGVAASRRTRIRA